MTGPGRELHFVFLFIWGEMGYRLCLHVQTHDVRRGQASRVTLGRGDACSLLPSGEPPPALGSDTFCVLPSCRRPRPAGQGSQKAGRRACGLPP